MGTTAGLLEGRAAEPKALERALDVGYADKEQNHVITRRPGSTP